MKAVSIMKFGISKLVMGFDGFLEIEEVEYTLAKTARQNLLEILFLEEKFDLVTENFYEYETELLSIASRMMIFSIQINAFSTWRGCMAPTPII